MDVIGDATHERYEAAIREVRQDDGVDGAIVILTPQAMTDHPEMAELDINPRIPYPGGEGCVVADSRMVLVRPQNGEKARRRARQYAASGEW